MRSSETVRGAYLCDLTSPGPVDLGAFTPYLEIDRMYIADRPGFIKLWGADGFLQDGSPFGELFALFESVSHAQTFMGWMENDFNLYGVPFWQRPVFATHSCGAWEVLAHLDRPSNTANQVNMRVERFPAQGDNARGMLRAWFESVKAEAGRRGFTTMYLVYSEAQAEAALVYFDDVPESQRDFHAQAPIGAKAPVVQGSTLDRSSWVYQVWFPFETGDTGRPSLWPMPGITPWNGDGVCEVSRHEMSTNSPDCLATCGNGAAEEGENFINCPGDVRLFH